MKIGSPHLVRNAIRSRVKMNFIFHLYLIVDLGFHEKERRVGHVPTDLPPSQAYKVPCRPVGELRPIQPDNQGYWDGRYRKRNWVSIVIWCRNTTTGSGHSPDTVHDAWSQKNDSLWTMYCIARPKDKQSKQHCPACKGASPQSIK